MSDNCDDYYYQQSYSNWLQWMADDAAFYGQLMELGAQVPFRYDPPTPNGSWERLDAMINQTIAYNEFIDTLHDMAPNLTEADLYATFGVHTNWYDLTLAECGNVLLQMQYQQNMLNFAEREGVNMSGLGFGTAWGADGVSTTLVGWDSAIQAWQSSSAGRNANISGDLSLVDGSQATGTVGSSGSGGTAPTVKDLEQMVKNAYGYVASQLTGDWLDAMNSNNYAEAAEVQRQIDYATGVSLGTVTLNYVWGAEGAALARTRAAVERVGGVVSGTTMDPATGAYVVWDLGNVMGAYIYGSAADTTRGYSLNVDTGFAGIIQTAWHETTHVRVDNNAIPVGGTGALAAGSAGGLIYLDPVGSNTALGRQNEQWREGRSDSLTQQQMAY
jgi:hypothetical protein